VDGDPLKTSNGLTYLGTVGVTVRQVFFETQGVRLGVSSSDLMVEELLPIARSITYDRGRDRLSG
jgi:hypothetical protein